MAPRDKPPGHQSLAVERVVGRRAEILQKVQRHAQERARGKHADIRDYFRLRVLTSKKPQISTTKGTGGDLIVLEEAAYVDPGFFYVRFFLENSSGVRVLTPPKKKTGDGRAPPAHREHEPAGDLHADLGGQLLHPAAPDARQDHGAPAVYEPERAAGVPKVHRRRQGGGLHPHAAPGAALAELGPPRQAEDDHAGTCCCFSYRVRVWRASVQQT